jgi:hypothetical protein
MMRAIRPAGEGRQANGESWSADGRLASVQAEADNQPKGRIIIDKQAPTIGPKIGKKGFVDEQGRIWIRDAAHAGIPIHWDVQIDDGADYLRVDRSGEEVQKS